MFLSFSKDFQVPCLFSRVYLRSVWLFRVRDFFGLWGVCLNLPGTSGFRKDSCGKSALRLFVSPTEAPTPDNWLGATYLGKESVQTNKSQATGKTPDALPGRKNISVRASLVQEAPKSNKKARKRVDDLQVMLPIAEFVPPTLEALKRFQPHVSKSTPWQKSDFTVRLKKEKKGYLLVSQQGGWVGWDAVWR